jgi:hypothetical protein
MFNRLAGLLPAALLSVSFLAGHLAPTGALADGHRIDDCTVITEPGNYVVVSDIFVDQGCVNPDDPDFGFVGIQIAASDVHVNLGGHTIYGDPAGYGDGFARGLDTSGQGLQANISVNNGHVDGMGTLSNGLYIQSAKYVEITGVSSTGNTGFGMGLIFCEVCSVSGSRFYSNENAGIQTVFAGDSLDGDEISEGGIRITGSEFSGSLFSNGITIGFFGEQHEIIGNRFIGNGFNGIGEFFMSGAPGHVIRGNRFEGNGFDGMRMCTSGNTIQANQVLDNGGNGIAIVEGFPCTFGPAGVDNLIKSNRSRGNGGVDMSDANADCLNSWTSNTFSSDSEGDGQKKGCIR